MGVIASGFVVGQIALQSRTIRHRPMPPGELIWLLRLRADIHQRVAPAKTAENPPPVPAKSVAAISGMSEVVPVSQQNAGSAARARYR